MRRVRIFETESFRFAALFAALFTGSALILGLVVYWTVNAGLREELTNAINEDVSDISQAYVTDGLAEAEEVIAQRMNSPGGPDFALLMDAGGHKLAGNLPAMEPRLGAFEIPFPPGIRHQERGDHHILGRGVMLSNGLYVFAGEDTYVLSSALDSVVSSVGSIVGVAAILAIGGGVLLSWGFLRRVNAIIQTCQAVIAGRLTDRIPTHGTHNELDLLSTIVNGMLDHIVKLMESLRQVSSDIAHDLRTPLTHLRQRLESAREKARSPGDYAAAIDRAISDSDELLAIFSALLRISQLEAGTHRAQLTTVDLSAMVNRVGEAYGPVAEDSGQTLLLHVTPGIRAHADSALLVQMFANIIENAIRHAPAGTRIAIDLTDNSGAPVVRISDNGPGIPADDRERVFRRFFRAEVSRATPGHGLGLSLVSAIADLHRVHIELSDNHPGLAVQLTFPVWSETAPEKVPTEPV